MSTSSMSNNISNILDDQEPSEESSWTPYINDYSYSKGSINSSSASMVSDAAWNGTSNDHHNNYDLHDHVKRSNLKNVLLKRTTNKRYSRDDHEDELEDTACSPVNSPTVCTLKHIAEVNPRRFDDFAVGNFTVKQGGPNNTVELGKDEKNGKNVYDSINTKEFVDLKKRGLCLMHVSALEPLVKYFG